MPRQDKPAQPRLSLFGADVRCPDLGNLPLIVEPGGAYEVFAPGSVYQPVLLTPGQPTIDVGPGRLDAYEEKFVRDLIRFLYPANNPPKSGQTPLAWNGREIWFKRNIEKDPRSFRLRVDDSDWYYPDFILWIFDRAARTQTFGFVDPKGLALGLGEGWANYKIVATIYMPWVIELQLAAAGQRVEWQGESWRFRIRGVLLSTSSLADLQTQAKFNLRDKHGYDIAGAEEDFRRARIVFQHNNLAYIGKVLNRLVEDTPLDAIMAAAARWRHAPDSFDPRDEVDFDLLLRRHEAQPSEADFIGALLRDYLKPDAQGKLGGWAGARRRLELLDYAKKGRLGLGAETAAAIRDHPRPCEELWTRKGRGR